MLQTIKAKNTSIDHKCEVQLCTKVTLKLIFLRGNTTKDPNGCNAQGCNAELIGKNGSDLTKMGFNKFIQKQCHRVSLLVLLLVVFYTETMHGQT